MTGKKVSRLVKLGVALFIFWTFLVFYVTAAKAEGPSWERYTYYTRQARTASCEGDLEMLQAWRTRANYEVYRLRQAGARREIVFVEPVHIR